MLAKRCKDATRNCPTLLFVKDPMVHFKLGMVITRISMKSSTIGHAVAALIQCCRQ